MNEILIEKAQRTILPILYQTLGYPIFDDGKPFNLNIGGIRAANLDGDSFNDFLYCFYRDKEGEWVRQFWPATTDPGLVYLKNPMNPLGCGILKRGFYPKSHGIGLHQQKYRALVQRGSLTLIRDFNRDNVRDIKPPDGITPSLRIENKNTIREWYVGGKLVFREETGKNFGVNIHHAGEDSTVIGKWSGACMVHKAITTFDSMMGLVDASLYLRPNLTEQTFLTDYALLEEQEITT